MDSSQYALPGETCNNAVLNKVLFYDLSRQTLSPGILTDFDAVAAFDRVIAGVSIATCQRVGLPRVAGYFMFHLLKQMKFHLITGFGQSSTFYHNNVDGTVGHRVLQGCSSAAPIFILNSDVSLSAFKNKAHGASFSHPINKTIITDFAIQYVDDTSQYVNNTNSNEKHLEKTLSQASEKKQLWADLLWVSGGNLNLGKCYYYAFQPIVDFKRNTITCKNLDSQSPISITNPATGRPHSICRTPPTTAQRALGAIIAPSGDGTQQLLHSLQCARELFGKFKASKLPNIKQNGLQLLPPLNQPISKHILQPATAQSNQIHYFTNGMHGSRP